MGLKRYTEAWTVWPFKPRKSQPHIFSPFLWTHALFLFMGPRASGEDSAQGQRVAGIPGGSATFHLNISVTQIENVNWNGPQGSLYFASSKGDFNLIDKNYKGRIHILHPGYSLSLYNLTLKDAGSYKAQINRKDTAFTTYKEFTLGVYEQLREPLVTLKSVAVSENASCTITLICSVQGEGKDIDYSWAPVDHNDSESSMSSTLTISWVPCGQDLSYTCTARNPVSERSSDPVFARQFCTDVEGPMEETVGLLGESIVLPLSLPASQDINRVLWIFNTSIISTWGEIATVDPVTQSKVRDKNEVWVSDQDHSLNFKRLRMEDAGRYHAYVCSTDSRVTSTKHVNLFVYGRLKKPKVTLTQVQAITENGSCTVQLACSVEDNAPNVKYHWTSSLQKGTVYEGSNFQASWRLGDNHPTLNCTASNPVSKSSQMFVSGDICPGPGTSRNILIVLLAIIFILIFFGILGWCTWRRKKKGSISVSALSQGRASTVPSAYENTDMPLMATGCQQRPSPVSTSFSDSTSDEDEERTEKQSSVHGEDEVGMQFTSKDSALHSASERKADYHLLNPGGTAPASVVNGSTLYAHLLFNSKGMNPIPQKDENSTTIYSFVQSFHKVAPTPQNSPESSEICTYENYT